MVVFLKQKYINNFLLILISILSIYFFLGIIDPLSSFLSRIYYLLLPFIVGIILAYLINPYVLKLRKRGVPKTISIGICLLVIFYLAVFLVINLIPIIVIQIEELNQNIPIYLNKIQEFIKQIKENASFIDIDESKLKLEGLKLFSNIGKYINVFFLSPIITLYILSEYDNIINFIRKKTMRHPYLQGYLNELNHHFLLYFESVILVMGLLSLTSAFLFALIGLDYSLILGFIVGITNIIPFIGPYIGCLIVVVYALTISPIKALYAFIIVWILQTIESNFFTPYLQGKRSSQPPLLILLSFSLFGSILGIIGMILAVPILSIISLGIKYYLDYRKNRNAEKTTIN